MDNTTNIQTADAPPGSLERVVSRRWRDRKCAMCNGRGLVPVTIIDVTADFECPNCDGTGNAGRWESVNDKLTDAGTQASD